MHLAKYKLSKGSFGAAFAGGVLISGMIAAVIFASNNTDLSLARFRTVEIPSLTINAKAALKATDDALFIVRESGRDLLHFLQPH